jgi:hypothetical protein
MSIESDYLELMPSTVSIYAQSSVDKYGKRTFSGSATTIQCRIQYNNDQMQDIERRLVTPKGKIYCYGSPAATTNHRLVLPDGQDAIIRQVQPVLDESGSHHTVIHFGD